MGDEQFEPNEDWRTAFQRRQIEDAAIRKMVRWARGFLVGVVVLVVILMVLRRGGNQ